MVPDSPDVELVLEGPDGVFSALQPGTIVIDMSSIAPGPRGGSPNAPRRSARRCSTRPSAVATSARLTGTLSIMVGGDRDCLRRREADPRRDGQS